MSTSPAQDRFGRRFRLFAWSAVLVASSFAQAPGRVVTDTKLDLVVDPLGFLGRAMSLWDPLGSAGQLQNQAYGYLFPMGPFFAVGELLQMPDWVVQRLWWSVVLVVAFLGVVALCEALGVGKPWTRILAGLAFAWSPRFLSVMGASSIEVWPSAVAPWVLVPLVIGLRRGDPRRSAAASAIAVACVGGVNAAATFAVVPLAVLLLVGAAPGPRRRTLMLWWPPLVLAGCLWWILPLFLLGRYSPPFLDFIESIDNTSFAATLVDSLRGTSNWVTYVDQNAVAGREVLSDPLLVLNGVIVMTLGLIGLTLKDLPRRGLWVGGVVLGLLLMTAGHQGAVAGIFSGDLRSLLDGVLAPLRNTHKFDVVVRLPLIIGLCHVVTRLTERGERVDDGQSLPKRIGVAVLATAAVVGATVPGWTGDVAPRKSFDAVPSYWTQAADWLGDEANGTTLLLPATPYGDYVWGKTGDEPLQPLASSRWIVRSIVPLTPGATIETLDTISNALQTGRGSPALATFLRRAGIGTFVLRHDIDRNQGAVSPELVRSALESTPGVSRVVEFGPLVGGGATIDDGSARPAFVDGGWQEERSAIEVYRLDEPVEDLRSQPLNATPTLIGDSDAMLALDRWGVLGDRSVVAAEDSEPDVGAVFLTDGNKRQEVAFGSGNRQRSATLTSEETYRADRRVHRYDEDRTKRWLSIPRLIGARSITASSSQSDVGAVPALDQASSPWAAFDGDGETAWRPDAAEQGNESWLRLDLGARQEVGRLRVTLDAPPDRRTNILVEADGRKSTLRVQGAGPASIDVGAARVLRLSATSRSAQPLAIADVSGPSLAISRPLRLPELPAGWGEPDLVALTGSSAQSDGCVTISQVLRCSELRYQAGESGRTIDREIPLNGSGAYNLSIAGQAYGGPALDAMLQQDRLLQVEASSHASPAPEGSVVRLLDGDRLTGWLADESDETPTLMVRWVGSRAIQRIVMRTAEDFAASAPSRVRLTFGDGTTVVREVVDGAVEFPRIRTSSVRVQVVDSIGRPSIAFDGSIRRLPIGVTELAVSGMSSRYVPSNAVPVRECGGGPTISIGDDKRQTRLMASERELLEGSTIRALPCGGSGVRLEQGINRLIVGGASTFRPTDVLLKSAQATAADVRPGDENLLATQHNQNPGWTASDGSTALEPVVVNGWQQGWRAREGTEVQFTENFAPTTTYRGALIFGAVLLLVLLLFSARPARQIAAGGSTSRRGSPSLLTVGVGALAVGVCLAGWLGLLAALAGAVAVGAWGARAWAVPTLAALGASVSGGYAVVARWGTGETWSGVLATPQIAVVFVVAVLLVSLGRRPTSFSLRKGRSTAR